MRFSLHQQWVLRLQIVIDYIVDIAFFLALGSLGMGQPGLVSLHTLQILDTCGSLQLGIGGGGSKAATYYTKE